MAPFYPVQLLPEVGCGSHARVTKRACRDSAAELHVCA